ncbi:peptidylprolyl isomerase [Dactylosporangium roseum]|nr:peptidylprolyl isomerase [Dactylosporangium roseum]
MSSSEQFEPPAPGAPLPHELAEPLPPPAPDPGAPGALPASALRSSAPRDTDEAEEQFPPPHTGDEAAPARRRRWVAPVVTGLGALLVLCGIGTVLVYVAAGEETRRVAAPLNSHTVSPGGNAGAPVGEAPITSPGAGTSRGPTAGPTAAAPPPATGVPCAYASAGRGNGEVRLATTPAPRATLTGKPTATMETNLGAIGLRLFADRAPCTVNSFVHLARDDFYTDTPCHRLTTDGLWVLQCGDPGGTGTGTPGYQFGDENLPTTLPPYPRGTLAMANAGPGTNGSQFFIVYKDSDIPPDYTVFGEVTSGLDLLDRIAAEGTATGTADGPPKLAVQITEIRAS